MAYELIYSNSDDSIKAIEFPSAKAAAEAGKRVGFVGGCPLEVRCGNDSFYAETDAKGETTFAMHAEGFRFTI